MERERERILLIEDSEDDANLMCRAFRSLQHPPLCAVVPDVISAQSYVCTHPELDLVVVEDRLSGEPGRRFLEWMRSHPDFDDIPVAVFARGPADPRPWRRAGAQAIVEKPFSYDDFVVTALKLLQLAGRSKLPNASSF